MIVSIHQPNYIPWLGYFFKIATSDVFVLLDDVQFTKNSYQNRVRIKGQGGAAWLTQPIQHSHLQSTLDVQFDTRIDWRSKHLKTLAANYAKAPHGREMLEQCRDWLDGTNPSLAETNGSIIRKIAALLGLKTEIVTSSSLDVNLTAGERLAEICRRLGADTYLSGKGGASYQDEVQFTACGVKLVYSDFAIRPYPQLWGGDFCAGLSILDALANVGIEGTRALLGLTEDGLSAS
jgi:hypothetical protein